MAAGAHSAPAAVVGKHRDGGIVRPQVITGADLAPELLADRRQRGRARPDPLAQCRAGEIDLLAGPWVEEALLLRVLSDSNMPKDSRLPIGRVRAERANPCLMAG